MSCTGAEGGAGPGPPSPTPSESHTTTTTTTTTTDGGGSGGGGESLTGITVVVEGVMSTVPSTSAEGGAGPGPPAPAPSESDTTTTATGTTDGGGGGGGGSLTGLTAVQGVFHFLPAPSDVLDAATACHRWRELACADSVWRARCEREGLVAKARAFEVALPAAEGDGGGAGGDGGGGSGAAAEQHEEAAGTWLAFYAHVSALEGYKMRDEDWMAMRKGNPDHDGGIRTAANLWCRDPAAAKARYGPIASWDISGVTNIAAVFCGKQYFNDDISRWDVSNVFSVANLFDNCFAFNHDLSDWDVGKVTHMNGAFLNATSFTHQLGGSWVTSTAQKYSMFRNSPGGIVGKPNQSDGAGVGTPIEPDE